MNTTTTTPSTPIGRVPPQLAPPPAPRKSNGGGYLVRYNAHVARRLDFNNPDPTLQASRLRPMALFPAPP